MKRKCFLNRLPLLKKLLLGWLMLVFIPTACFCVYLYDTSFHTLYRELLREKRNTLEQYAINIETRLDSLQTICLSITSSSMVRKLVGKRDLGQYPVFSQRYLNDAITLTQNSLNNQELRLRGYCFFADSKELVDHSLFFDRQALREQPFYQMFLSSAQSFQLYLLNAEETKAYYAARGKENVNLQSLVLIVQDVKQENTQASVGVLILETVPVNLLASLKQESHSLLVFTDTMRTIGWESSSWSMEQPFDESGTTTMNGLTYIYSPITGYPLVMVDTVPLDRNSFLIPAIQYAAWLFGMLLLQTLAFALLLRNSFRRTNQQLTTMDDIIQNAYVGRLPVHGHDEIDQIAVRYNRMLDRIAQQSNELVQHEKARQSAQYEALRQQINPHFIYNTLSIFEGVAEQNGDLRLSDAIAFFGHLLRYNLHGDEDFSTLEQELNNVVAIVNICTVDAKHNIELTTDVAPDMNGLLVMKYLLQPLVENAVVHGSRHDGSVLHICISASMQNPSFLQIEVKDDGIGIGADRLVALRNHLETGAQIASSPGHTFIGLTNLQKRLELFYHVTAKMEIFSEEARCTSIRFLLPVRKEEAPHEIVCRSGR